MAKNSLIFFCDFCVKLNIYFIIFYKYTTCVPHTMQVMQLHIQSFSVPSVEFLDSTTLHIKNNIINFGPQHPAAHGILRIVMQMRGEIIQKSDAQFGLLHRGTEKLIEARSVLQSVPYFDRFDYVANVFQEHVYCLAIEALMVSSNSYDVCLNYTRTLFDELSRILNHLLTLSATSLDLSSMGPIFWAFEERERIMEFFERVTGARMHTALYKPFDFDWTTFSRSLFLDLSKFLMRCSRSLSGAFLGLLNNRILKSRLASVGMFSASKLNNYSISGIMARGAGLRRDLRLRRCGFYGAYWYLSFRSFMGRRGDNLDRFIIRIKEVLESFRIISQVLGTLMLFVQKPNTEIAEFSITPLNMQKTPKAPASAIKNKQTQLSSYSWSFIKNLVESRTGVYNTKSKYTSMESLIEHFKMFSEGVSVPAGIAYQNVESPKGELGIFIVSNGSCKPYRVKLRTPVSHNMNIIPAACVGVTIADFVATFCSLDIVLGEIDR